VNSTAPSRCDRRPRENPIAASVVKPLQVSSRALSVVGLDCLDGTPRIDIEGAAI
jgi:tRNA (Thr-GGU) A37 N-methylase